MNQSVSAFILFIFFIGCKQEDAYKMISPPELIDNAYNVGFLIMDGVYNTELTAPFDIFQHTKYREGIKPMNVFTVAKTNDIITSFEGLKIIPDYAYTKGNVPEIDILVVPSAEHHLDSDLEDKVMIEWVKQTAEKCEFVTSHCDGAFVLAKAGLLNNTASTTFPSDVELYKNTFPELEVISDVLFVHDGKYITSAGGAKSFEASLYLCEYLYGKEVADRLAQGLVIDWQLENLKYIKVK
ncbi:MAG: glutamine amidotransferase [Saprospiraceae bacterium]|nr:DJ-1/PfpI family protein [Bacteroidia bacterium]NNE15848.1 glutamine amidotransferase [Saprospiraceae bacterium]NNL92897.1 glutamine amidotransferase [Saprospiraceae bacterium]